MPEVPSPCAQVKTTPATARPKSMERCNVAASTSIAYFACKAFSKLSIDVLLAADALGNNLRFISESAALAEAAQ